MCFHSIIFQLSSKTVYFVECSSMKFSIDFLLIWVISLIGHKCNDMRTITKQFLIHFNGVKTHFYKQSQGNI